MLKMREHVSNRLAKTDERNTVTCRENSVTKDDKKYLLKRMAERCYSFVQT